MGKDWERNLSACQDPKLTRVCIPLSAQNSPLMKDLKRGQKCYFYSIMKIYDSRAPRETLHRRYAINLQCQNVLGLITKQQLRRYASYLNDATCFRGPGLRRAPRSLGHRPRGGPARAL